MSFLYPEFLYYILLPMLLLFGLILSKKSSEELYFSSEVMEKLRVSANTLTLNVRNWLFLVMGVLILIALSGPVINDGVVEVKAKSADIMIALDISDSMLAEDVYPNRLKLAKQKALELLKLAPNERIGVIGFAKNSYLVSPLSFDTNAVAFLLRELRTDSITEKGTDFLSMLNVVDKSIKKESKKYLLILSDGGDSEDFRDEIAYAKEHKIVVFVLAIGTSKGAPIKREDGSFLKHNGEILISKRNDKISTLATKTGGVYIKSVNSNADIRAMLKEIEAHSEKKELKSQEINRYIALFYYPLALALFLLLIATSSFYKKIEKNAVLVFFMSTLFVFSEDAKAGVTDFMLLDKAEEAYKTRNYEEAQKIYEEYAKERPSADAEYNRANTLYKQKKYKQAQKIYEGLKLDGADKQAKNYANLGNSYVKSQEKDGLQKAVKAYEDSLKIREDKEVRENLEAVKKAIKEQEKKEDKNQKNNKDNKDKKDKEENKDKKEKSDKDKKKDKSDSSEKNDKKEKGDEKSEKNKDKKSDKKSEDEKKKEQEKDKEEDKEEDKANKDKEKKSEKKEKKSEKKDKTKELKDNNSSKEMSQAQIKKGEMSDAEEKKWLKQLSKQQSTFLYRLNDNNKFKDNTDEKPW
ncbi:MAG: VWA domain-containing protein [Sulfurimonas sp.]|nr:VWA domain-containing protein [Sulfurimonas sp.]